MPVSTRSTAKYVIFRRSPRFHVTKDHIEIRVWITLPDERIYHLHRPAPMFKQSPSVYYNDVIYYVFVCVCHREKRRRGKREENVPSTTYVLRSDRNFPRRRPLCFIVVDILNEALPNDDDPEDEFACDLR